MTIDQLAALAPPPELPTEPGSKTRLSEIEGLLKTALPDDYVEFGSLYGTGTFDDGNIRIFSPYWPDYQIWWQARIDALRSLREWDDLGRYNAFPDEDGLLPFGDDENGTILTWCTRGHPNDWTVVVVGHGGGTEAFDLPFSEFLVQALTNKIKVGPWHEKFTSKDLDFRPL